MAIMTAVVAQPERADNLDMVAVLFSNGATSCLFA